MQTSYSDSGVIVRIVDSGEADKYITMVTSKYGLSQFVAKGARRPASRKSSHLDLFNHVSYLVGRGELPQYLNQVETINYYPAIKKDYQKVQLCLSIAEILSHTLPSHAEDKEMYLSLIAFLDGLSKEDDLNKINSIFHRFGLYIIRHLGYPEPNTTKTNNLSAYFESIMNRKIISKEIR